MPHLGPAWFFSAGLSWAYQAISCLLARRPSHLKKLPSGRTHPPGSHAVQLLGRAPPSTALGPARSLEGLKAISHLFQLWGPRPEPLRPQRARWGVGSLVLTLSARDLVRPLGQAQLPRKVHCEHFTGQRLKCTVAPRGPARNAGWSRATPPKTGSFLPRMAGSMPLLGRAPHGIAWGPARSLEGLAAAPQTDSAVGPRRIQQLRPQRAVRPPALVLGPRPVLNSLGPARSLRGRLDRRPDPCFGSWTTCRVACPRLAFARYWPRNGPLSRA